MISLLSSSLGRLRIIAFLEGTSFLLILFVTMPMKYFLNMPEGNKIIGTLHGALFIIYILMAFNVHFEYKWKFTKTTWKVLLASIVPFGTFWVDKNVLKIMNNE
jgi:integral membrane protein